MLRIVGKIYGRSLCQAELKKMSQVAVDSSMGYAGIAQPHSVLKLAAMIDKNFLGVLVAVSYAMLFIGTSIGKSACYSRLYAILTT